MTNNKKLIIRQKNPKKTIKAKKMAATTIDICLDKTNKLVDSIEKTVRLITLPGHIVQLYLNTIILFFKSKKMTRFFKTKVVVCSKTCSTAKECLSYICEGSTKIRDGHLDLYQQSKRIPFLKPQSLIFKHLLDEWDDLVEDYTIASDPEVNNLLSQIADVA